MAYLGDIRENSISPEGIIWENDNRKDARYYWNGAFIDLCDLPGEDYAKTIFVTSGSGSSDTPVTPGKVNNPITVQEIKYVNENGEEVYAYKAVSKQPVTSDVIVEMTIQDEFGVEENIVITVPNGSASSEIIPTKILMMMTPPKIVTSDHNPKEDDKFEYEAFLPEETPDYPMAYSITLLSGVIDSISDDILINKLRENGMIEMKDSVTSKEFLVKFTPIAVDGLSSMSVKDQKQALKDNAQDIIIVTDKPIKTIAEAVTNFPETELWNKRQGNVVIDGVSFDIWYKRDENQTSQSLIYDPETGYKNGTETAKYIIYYE